MLKLRHALIPVCISSGPLFMVRLGFFENSWGSVLSLVGALMLSYGLMMIFDLVGRLVVTQQKAATESTSDRAHTSRGL
jgi:hypothetical protein